MSTALTLTRRGASLIQSLGGAICNLLEAMGRLTLFLVDALVVSVTPPWKVRTIVYRLAFIGFQSLVVVMLTGLFTGMVLALQGHHALKGFGSQALLGPMVGLSLVRELGPVIGALMVTGRAGSAITAEIGVMRVGEQIDALELMGLNPMRYLVAPSLIAALIAMPLLTAVFNVVGIFGGWLVGVKLLGVSEGTYFGEMIAYVDMSDILGGFYKAVTFGLIIVWVSCYKGFHSDRTSEGVSRSTTQAVVLASVLILVWDYVMTSLLF